MIEWFFCRVRCRQRISMMQPSSAEDSGRYTWQAERLPYISKDRINHTS
jgi:hypothetical protein